MSGRGAVAAGHPVTAEAGAEVLREGGNAVDAAVCAVLTSFVCESPLTGFGAGGFMLVHSGSESTLTDFFVAAGGADGVERTAELVPIPVYFDGTPQTFNCGAASCGVPGNPAGLEHVLERHGSMPLSRLVEPGVRLGRDGVEMTSGQAYFHEILHPILTSTPECAALYAPEGRRSPRARSSATRRCPTRWSASPRRARSRSTGGRWPAPSPSGCASAVAPSASTTWRPTSRSSAAGQRALPRDGGAHQPAAVLRRDPDRVFAGDPRAARRVRVEEIVAATEAANERRTDDFHEGLHDADFVRDFLAADLDEVAGGIKAGDWIGGRSGAGGPGEMLGSTTHICRDRLRGHVRLGHLLQRHRIGTVGSRHRSPRQQHARRGGPEPSRLPPDPAGPQGQLDDGADRGATGRPGRSRDRQRRLEPDPFGDPSDVRAGHGAGDGDRRGRSGRAYPLRGGDGAGRAGGGSEGLDRLETRGVPVVRWERQNLFFGGVQAVTRNPETGEMGGGGDPRRGGAVVLA